MRLIHLTRRLLNLIKENTVEYPSFEISDRPSSDTWRKYFRDTGNLGR